MNLFEIIFYFLRLGVLGFGGPLALVAQMQKDLAEDRKWMKASEFATALPLIKSMPGPVAFQTAVFFGYTRGQFLGGLCAGFFLLLPSFIFMIALAYFAKFSLNNSNFTHFLTGLQLGAVGIIAASVWSLMVVYKNQVAFWVLFVASLVISSFNLLAEPIIIFLMGGILIFWRHKTIRSRSTLGLAFLFPGTLLIHQEKLSELFLLCIKAGAFVFGTGLAIVPMLENDFVTNRAWLSHDEFMNALAFGQVTPGPVMISVTYIGYKVLGLTGAITATIGAFLPSFIHMVTWFPRVVNRLSQMSWIVDFSCGAISAVAATIFVSLYKIMLNYDVNYLTLGIAFGSFAILMARKLPVWAIIPLSGFLYLFLV